MPNAQSILEGLRLPRCLLVLPTVALFAVGCSDSAIDPLVPTSLQLEPEWLELVVGASAELTVSMTDQNGNALPISAGYVIQWSSSSEDVATVVDGLVVAEAPGEAVIAAQADGLPPAQATVIVVKGSGFEALILDALGGSQSNGWVISDAGVAAGWSNVSGGRAIRWPESGPPSDFLGADSGTRGINNLGAIVGWVRHPDGMQRAYVFVDGERIDLEPLPGWTGPAAATGINANGTVVGRHQARVVVWQLGADGAYGVPVDMGRYALGSPDINDHGDIVFTADLPTDYGWRMRPVLRRATPDGGYDEPIHLGAPSDDHYAAHAINNAGLVVGVRYDGWYPSATYAYAVLWHPDDYASPIDLGIGEAWDINDHNHVVGSLGGLLPVFGGETRRPGLWTVDADGAVLEEIDLGVPAGFTSGGARGISNEGSVIGSSWGRPGVVEATLWRPLK
jgi:probable HAF family extracellular repeat protein